MVILLLFILILSSCSSNDSESRETSLFIRSVPIPNAEILASNLTIPWDIVKSGDELLISERVGRIRSIKSNGLKIEMGLRLEQEITPIGEGGLLGFVLHPQFDQNGLAYLYYTYRERGNTQNRIVQVRLREDLWVEEKEILGNLPGGRIHNGGRLDIGQDGKLYATVGDAGNPDFAQDLNRLAGKILRMNLDGTIPNDNPFKDSYVYSYGHRNPQGITWDEKGAMYAAEHGAQAHDEINLIKPGHNYGWPIIQGDETQAGMETPLFHSGINTWAPSGLAYYQGKLYIAGLAGQQLRVFELESGKNYPLYENVGRLRDLLVDEGLMYIITNNTDGRGIPDEDDDHLLKIKLSD